MASVLFVGDINVDLMLGGMESLPVPDREVTCKTFELTIGSASAICSCNYAALGGNASFLGLAGEDDYGDFMLRGMESFGIRTDLIQRTSRVRTGVTVNLIYRQTRTQVTYPGTIAEFDGRTLGADVLKQFDHVHLAGPYQETNFRPRITSVLSLARELGVTTSLDPQWDNSQRWEFMDEWLPLLTFLFLNGDEACSITGGSHVEEACRKLAERTACPVVKDGSQGACLPWQGKVLTVPAFKVELVDTTGAGDAFDAGFMYALLEKGMEHPSACEFANATAARSCMFVGGVNARSSYDSILEFIRAQKGTG